MVRMIYDVTDMSQYLRGYGRALADRIKDQAEPLYSPGDEWDERLYGLHKKPYQAQGDAVMAISKLLDTSDSAMLVGEMGCGKTLMGLAVPYVHNRPDKLPRTLVMCPGHLVGKWQREARETIPGGDGRIIRGLSDVLGLERDDPRDRPLYYIVSKDRAKLGYAWKPAAVERRGVYACPRCYDTVTDTDGVPVDYEYLKRNRRECGGCGSALWQADNERVRRYPVAEYIKHHLNGYFDYLIADEVHEMKGGDTAQGNSFGALAGACGKSIALTGTLLGGYADDVFYVLYRLAPGRLKGDGLDYGQVAQWMARYGVLERTTK